MYYVPDIILNALHVLAHLIITAVLEGRCCYYLHCTDFFLNELKDRIAIFLMSQTYLTKIRTWLSSRSHFSFFLLCIKQKTDLKSMHKAFALFLLQSFVNILMPP